MYEENRWKSIVFLVGFGHHESYREKPATSQAGKVVHGEELLVLTPVRSSGC